MVFSLSFQRRLRFDEHEVRLLRSEAERVGAPDIATDLLDEALFDIQASRALLTERPEQAFAAVRQAEFQFANAQSIIFEAQDRSFHRWSTAARADFWVSEAMTIGGMAYFNPVLALAFAAGPNMAYVSYVDSQFEVMREGVSRMAIQPLQNPLNDEANEALIQINPSFPNARFGDYFVRRELDDLRGNRQVSDETRRGFQDHWRHIQGEVRNYRPDRYLPEEDQIVAVAQQIYYSAHLGSYEKGQSQLLNWFEHGGGNCKLQTKVYASLLAESPVIKPPWRITVRYYDGDENNDGHCELILYNSVTGRMINPKSGEIFSESDSPLFDARTLYADDLILHGQDPIHDFSHYILYTPPSWSISQYASGEEGNGGNTRNTNAHASSPGRNGNGISPAGPRRPSGTTQGEAQRPASVANDPASASPGNSDVQPPETDANSAQIPQPLREGRSIRASVGVVGHLGFASQTADTPPPRLREFTPRTRRNLAQVVDDLPQAMSREKVAFLLNEPRLFNGTNGDYFDQSAFEIGIPFRLHYETQRIQFASYPFYQRFRNLRSGQQRFEYLRSLTEQFLARHPMGQTRARFLLENSGNFAFYTPPQLMEATEYLQNVDFLRSSMGYFKEDFTHAEASAATNLLRNNSADRIVSLIAQQPLYSRSLIYAFFAVAQRLRDELALNPIASDIFRVALSRLRPENAQGHERTLRPVSPHNVIIGRFDTNTRGVRGVFTTPTADPLQEGGMSASPLPEETIFAFLARANAGGGILDDPFHGLNEGEKRTLARYIRRAIGAQPNLRLPHNSPQERALLLRLARLQETSEEGANEVEARMRNEFNTRTYTWIFQHYVERHMSLMILLGRDTEDRAH